MTCPRCGAKGRPCRTSEEGLTKKKLHKVLLLRNGQFIWKESRGRAVKGGEACKSKDRHGYPRLRVFGVLRSAHRLAWLYTYGCWPSCDIDHINRDIADYRIVNLRAVSRSLNNHNSHVLPRHGSSGLIGARRHKQSGRWQSSVSYNGNLIFLGLFDSALEAHRAYVAKRIEIGRPLPKELVK